jgi:FimV-like protein
LASIPTHTAPIPAAPPAPQNPVDDTEQSKLNLAAQLLAKGDKDLARALILSVISSTHGELKARAIQMLGQIR